jgi:hypothetical protein
VILKPALPVYLYHHKKNVLKSLFGLITAQFLGRFAEGLHHLLGIGFDHGLLFSSSFVRVQPMTEIVIILILSSCGRTPLPARRTVRVIDLDQIAASRGSATVLVSRL